MIYPSIAAIKGIVPIKNSVIATVVFIIEKINPMKATAKKKPPMKSEKFISIKHFNEFNRPVKNK